MTKDPPTALRRNSPKFYKNLVTPLLAEVDRTQSDVKLISSCFFAVQDDRMALWIVKSSLGLSFRVTKIIRKIYFFPLQSIAMKMHKMGIPMFQITIAARIAKISSIMTSSFRLIF